MDLCAGTLGKSSRPARAALGGGTLHKSCGFAWSDLGFGRQGLKRAGEETGVPYCLSSVWTLVGSLQYLQLNWGGEGGKRGKCNQLYGQNLKREERARPIVPTAPPPTQWSGERPLALTHHLQPPREGLIPEPRGSRNPEVILHILGFKVGRGRDDKWMEKET